MYLVTTPMPLSPPSPLSPAAAMPTCNIIPVMMKPSASHMPVLPDWHIPWGHNSSPGPRGPMMLEGQRQALLKGSRKRKAV